ncbi:hypothetical protein [Elizabethkingia sp. YR214]|uniref:hypothetical protein n=1 Tax=Elizabethkingia sp. YR214 TaxID=2135667 RepID=UPI000D305213|nr:hypothetical protein [Elizabethkingia sp. YR214]
MKEKNYISSGFSIQSMIAAALPSYIFPALMSFLSGYFFQKTELMAASYTTIGMSSLLSTILSFIILWQFRLRLILARNKSIRSLLIILLMMALGLAFTFITNLPSERFNITFSAFLGAAIITIRQQIKDYKDEQY